MKAALQKFCLILAGIIGALFFFELSIRVLPRSLLPPRIRDLAERMELNRRSDSTFVPDRDLLFKIPPDTDFIARHHDFTMRFKTNLNLDDIGFRGGSLGGPVWGVAVGDSYTFGVGVDLEKVWTILVARSVGREILNLGIPGQGPPQYTRVLKRYALPMRPRVVFYGLYYNDVQDSHRFYRSKRTLLPFSRYARQYSFTYNLIQARRGSSAKRENALEGDARRGKLTPDSIVKSLKGAYKKFDERWEIAARELREAVHASRDANVQLVILYFPSREQVYWDLMIKKDNLPSSLQVDRLPTTIMKFCGAERIACLDLTGPLRDAARQGRELYFPIDGHWNEEGNRVVAEAIQKFLMTGGIVK